MGPLGTGANQILAAGFDHHSNLIDWQNVSPTDVNISVSDFQDPYLIYYAGNKVYLEQSIPQNQIGDNTAQETPLTVRLEIIEQNVNEWFVT